MSMEANMTVPPEGTRKKPKYGPKLREARFEDYDQIAGLESRSGSRSALRGVGPSMAGKPLYRGVKNWLAYRLGPRDEDGKIVRLDGKHPIPYMNLTEREFWLPRDALGLPTSRIGARRLSLLDTLMASARRSLFE